MLREFGQKVSPELRAEIAPAVEDAIGFEQNRFTLAGRTGLEQSRSEGYESGRDLD